MKEKWGGKNQKSVFEYAEVELGSRRGQMEVYEAVCWGNMWVWPLEMMSLYKQTGEVHQGSLLGGAASRLGDIAQCMLSLHEPHLLHRSL